MGRRMGLLAAVSGGTSGNLREIQIQDYSQSWAGKRVDSQYDPVLRVLPFGSRGWGRGCQQWRRRLPR